MITAEVPSATNLAVSSCAPGTSATDFGVVQPSATALTSSCSVTFGSSNDSATLKLFQGDLYGSALVRPSDGTPSETAPFTGGASKYPRAGYQYPYGGIVNRRGGGFVQVGYEDNPVLVGYDADGNVDTTGWGTGGVTTVDLFPNVEHFRKIVTQSDGKLVAGGTGNDLTSDVSYLVRFDTDGTVDTTFGTAGHLFLDVDPGADDYISDIEVLDDDSLLVVGGRDNGPAWETYAAKITADGQLDTSFATNGIFDNAAATDIPDWWDMPSIEVQSSGRILLLQDDEVDAFVTALTSSGALDTGWGAASGRTTIDPAVGISRWLGAEVDSQDRLVVSAGFQRSDVIVARLAADGTSMDASFGSGGFATLSIPGADANTIDSDLGLLLDAADRIYVGGRAKFSLTWWMWVGKVNATGTGWDPDFGTSGIAKVFYDNETYSYRGGMAWQDGDIFMGGAWNTPYDLELGRLVGAASFDDYGGGATWSSGATQSMFGACLETATNATPVWTEAAGASACTKADAAHWHDVPATDDATSRVASVASGTTTGSVELVFGIKASSTQPPGDYLAPLTFQVVAPAV